MVILGFPLDNFSSQEFDNIEKTIDFCEIKFGVTFSMFAKVDVKGEDAETLLTFLTSKKKGLLTKGVKGILQSFLLIVKAML